MNASLEAWREVVGYEGLYEVSNLGNVKSVDRTVTDRRGSKKKLHGKILCKMVSKKGYNRVQLWKNGAGRYRFVSHLVAEAFIGKREHGLIVLHGVNGSLDDSLKNLSYGSYKENSLDKLRDGTMPMGETHWKSKLTEEQVRLIILMAKLGWHKKKIGELLNITYQNVHAVVTGKTWKHII
jgi:hypothetical protein